MSTELTITPEVLALRGVDESTWSALKNSIYPGAKDESVLMAVDYCRARQLDPLMKPVHLVPMSVKDGKTGKNEWRDVVMPGVGLYRIQADRSGNYAGASEPVFGPLVDREFNGGVKVSFPEWCKYSVFKRMADGKIVEFVSKEYWIENYATAGEIPMRLTLCGKSALMRNWLNAVKLRRFVKRGLKLVSNQQLRKWKARRWTLLKSLSAKSIRRNRALRPAHHH
jgi:phage recombination protein Bet